MDEELTGEFWKGCADSRLLVQECVNCANRWFVPEVWCPRCRNRVWRWAQSPGLGEVYSFTTVHRGMSPDLPVPYVLVVVDLDDGWTMMSRLVNSCENPAIGMRVRVTFIPDAENAKVLPCFEPVPER